MVPSLPSWPLPSSRPILLCILKTEISSLWAEDPQQHQIRNKVHSKCNTCESSWNHPASHPWSMEKLSPMKPAPGAKRSGTPGLHYLGRVLLDASLVARMVKSGFNLVWIQFQPLDWEDPLEKGMVTHSSILAWRIPWTEEPGGLQSTESQKSWTQQQLTLALLFEFLVCPLSSLMSTLLTASQGSVKHSEFVHLVKTASCRLH